jgi:hypothetical protein
VKLTAVPADGMQLDNWIGACRTDDPVCTVTLAAPRLSEGEIQAKDKR